MVLNDLKHTMGFPETVELSAKLHNMLLYEPGQFFGSHQDSEKCDGMLASLIVVLPSEHAGGTLVIDHQGEKKQFQTSRFSLDKLTCIGFYADCYHQAKKSDFRLPCRVDLQYCFEKFQKNCCC